MARNISKAPAKKTAPRKKKKPAPTKSQPKNNKTAGPSARANQLESIGPVGKAIAILEIIIANGKPVTISEIERITGFSKNSINRSTKQLSDIGLIEREKTPGGFVVAPGLIKLSLTSLASASSRGIRRAILRNLSKKLNQTINFGVLSGSDVVFLDRADAERDLALRVKEGSRIPAHCTSIGKLLLSQLPTRKLRRTIRNMPLDRRTKKTITDRDEFRNAIEEIAKTEIGIDDQEYVDGIVCLAVLVTGDKDNSVFGAMSIAALTTRHSIEDLRQFLPQLRKAADKLGQTFEIDEDEE